MQIFTSEDVEDWAIEEVRRVFEAWDNVCAELAALLEEDMNKNLGEAAVTMDFQNVVSDYGKGLFDAAEIIAKHLSGE